MPGVATGETFSFAEGRLYLYASASGNTSGSGIGFAENASLKFAYGWVERVGANNRLVRVLTGQRADLAIGTLLADLALFRLANATAAVNAKFEGLVSAGAALQKSAVWVLYSGVVDEAGITQGQGQLFRGNYSMHAHEWSAFGQ
jgi:hypothetical protein